MPTYTTDDTTQPDHSNQATERVVALLHQLSELYATISNMVVKILDVGFNSAP